MRKMSKWYFSAFRNHIDVEIVVASTAAMRSSRSATRLGNAYQCHQVCLKKALHRAEICTNCSILACYLVDNAISSKFMDGVNLVIRLLIQTVKRESSFVGTNLHRIVCFHQLYPLVSFRFFIYSCLLIWYLPICLLTCESYLLYSIFLWCLI